MHFDRSDLSDAQLLSFYKSLVYPRLIEEKMLLLLRQGKISKWFSGIGQEAIAVGATLALDADEWIMPLHRNLGVFTTREMPLDKLFLQWQGSENGYSKGRERSFHFGSRAHHICGMISHLGPQLSIADGIALAADYTATFSVASGTTSGYYDHVNTSSPEQLRCSLHQTIKGHTVYPYSGTSGPGQQNVWTILEIAQEDPNDPSKIIDLYRNHSFTAVTDRDAGNGGSNKYNREHTWPNSLGFKNDQLAAYTDTHMLWLADKEQNADRGNKPLANCSSGCTELGTDVNNGFGGAGQSNWYKLPDGNTGSFEVWNHRKGDIARSIFYMAIRYEGIASEAAHDGTIPDLELTDDRSKIIVTSNTAAKAYMGLLTDLLAWNEADPPDAEEVARNDVIQGFQGNRNPFIDHPEWATRALFESSEPATCELAQPNDTIFENGFESVTLH